MDKENKKCNKCKRDALPEKSICEYHSAHNAEIRAAKRERGECKNCKNKAEPGTSTCIKHKESRKIHDAANKEGIKEQQIKKRKLAEEQWEMFGICMRAGCANIVETMGASTHRKTTTFDRSREDQT